MGLRLEYGIHCFSGDVSVLLLVQQCRRKVSVEDHNIDLIASPSETIDNKSGGNLVPIWQVRTKDIAAYRRVLGRHFPAMALLEVSGLLEPAACVEIQALAVIGVDDAE